MNVLVLAEYHRIRYQPVADKLQLPWYMIAAIHYRESNYDFTKHLHNGDPLTAKTVHVPAGRPAGTPPFTWYQSALDALRYVTPPKNEKQLLSELEKYNGLGYAHRNMNSPYIWAGTDQYIKGKYTSDGKFDENAVDKQLGCVFFLKLKDKVYFSPKQGDVNYSIVYVQLYLNQNFGTDLKVDGICGPKTMEVYKLFVL